MKKLSSELKVGIFAAAVIALVAYSTLQVSDRGVLKGGDYRVMVFIDSAEGLDTKTPVEIAGIQVGYVDELQLHEGRRAKAVLRLSQIVKLGQDAKAQVRTKGFLGETYVELLPGNMEGGLIGNGGQITATNPYVDLGQIASDMREISDSLKSFTKVLADTAVKNQENINMMLASLSSFSQDLSEVMSERKESLKDTIENMELVTRRVEEGRGTIGRLINDEEIANNINNAAAGLSETVGGINRFQIGLDYHSEYLGETEEFKNYVGILFQPRPDKYFKLDFVVDPSPSAVRTITTTNVTAGGATTTIVSDENVVERDRFRISAQLAKKFHDITFRGGLIESTGGVGVDYHKGPFGVEFSAFDFRTDNGQKPHLKALGSFNITRNFFLVYGLDDFISTQQDPDWFFGAGLRLVDNDIKSLLGAASLK